MQTELGALDSGLPTPHTESVKPNPARPIYEPRNVTVRRELFRFADANHIICTGSHAPGKSVAQGEVWNWQFSGANIPLWELVRLFHVLYPQRAITISAHMAEDGTEIVLIAAPVLPDLRRDL